jgi:hypothetical protein
LPPGEILNAAEKFAQVSPAQSPRGAVNLRCRSPDVVSRLRYVIIKFIGCTANGSCKAADKVRSRVLLILDRIPKLVTRVGGQLLCALGHSRDLFLYAGCCVLRDFGRLLADVARQILRLLY